MAGSTAKRPMDTRKKRIWAWQEGEGLHPSNTQFKEGMKGREHEPKSPHIFLTTRDKHQPKRTVESDKHDGNRNGMKARKKQIQTEVEHTQRAKTPPTCT